MTANTLPQTNTFACSIKAVEVVYHVADAKTSDQPVRVSETGAYSCGCRHFALDGECFHTRAVEARRKAEGRKF